MSQPATNSPESLLENFLQSGRSEESFTRLVKATGGLVYGSALRRTRDLGLAEEAAQNVFTILAKKAESLRNHSSLSSWLYRTASFEAAKALRNEGRHRRRIENYTAEAMHESAEVQISEDTLQLLEQSIDRLSKRDRALLLSRFFEGKKFRDIAATTGQSEAACKVRLRRIMDKMASWLSSRGCRFSVTALASLLTTEWSRACPPALISGTAGFLQSAPLSISSLLSPVLATMKISKMTIAGIALLISAAAAPFVLNHAEKTPSETTIDPKVNVTSSIVANSKRSTGHSRSVEEILANYPFAYQRLEELYQQYPNLRLPEFVPTDEVTLLDEFNRYFESLDNQLSIPREIQKQMHGEAQWDSASITRFLEENQGAVDRLLEISKFPTQPSHFRYLISERTPETLNTIGALRLLELAFLHETRSNNPQQAEVLFDAILMIREGLSTPFVAQGFVENAAANSLLKGMRSLSQDGYDFSSFADRLDQFAPRKSLISSLQLEAGSFISLLESAKQLEDRTVLIEQLAPIMNPVTKEDGQELTVADQFLMRKEALDWNLNDFQDAYAKVISGYLERMPDPARPETMLRLEGDGSGTRTSLAGLELTKGRDWILASFVPKMELFTSKIAQIETLKRELNTWNALNQAKASGLKPIMLLDLVPDFLPEVPVNPVTGEAFAFDAKTQSLSAEE